MSTDRRGFLATAMALLATAVFPVKQLFAGKRAERAKLPDKQGIPSVEDIIRQGLYTEHTSRWAQIHISNDCRYSKAGNILQSWSERCAYDGPGRFVRLDLEFETDVWNYEGDIVIGVPRPRLHWFGTFCEGAKINRAYRCDPQTKKMLNRLTEYMLRCFNINVESVRDNVISQLFVPFIQNPQYPEREQRWVAETFPASQIRARLVPTCEQVLAMGKDLPPSADIKSWLDSRRSWEERVSQIARCT